MKDGHKIHARDDKLLKNEKSWRRARVGAVIFAVVWLLISYTSIKSAPAPGVDREMMYYAIGWLLFWVVLFAWAGIASAFCPSLIMTLFWKGTNRYGVAIGALGGFMTAVIWGIFFRDIIYEMVPGFVAGFVLTYLGSLVTQGLCKESGVHPENE